ncbi:tetratricopeptide repeat-containing glycosyltransferase family 2 protein [Bacillus sp. WLY-B-L8]|uniref:tetratricopeptide repeat-containing glycosyltransferase family 2 protein n=1 Tax=Bacillus multifaciens TaxID=3068506 RepID=UPI0027419AD6|nr:glycosyltransferase family 2 protein [Bacillus sp. WLY-B-L8]MDP7980147.1 glycosyltransferase family 2 protein [Bacillus sp. WLY-B-L8]
MSLISFCMICKDEEKRIGACLKSIVGIVDEIIVVDTGSIDHTVEIAERYATKILHFEWNDDFSAARNYALEHATGKWILFLDADEELDEHTAPLLRSLATENKHPAYFLQIVNHISNKGETIVETCPVLRFFRNDNRIRFTGEVHEQIGGTIAGVYHNELVAYTEIQIHHYGYLEEIVQEKKKKERNMTLVLKQVRKEPDNPFHHYNLAGEYIRVGSLEDALFHLRKVKELCDISHMGFGPLTIKKEIFTLYSLDRKKEVLNVCREENKRFPYFPDLLFMWGRVAAENGLFAEAIRIYSIIVSITEVPLHYTMDEGIINKKAPFELAKLLERKNRKEALALYKKVLQHDAQQREVLERIMALLESIEEVEDIFQMFHYWDDLPLLQKTCEMFFQQQKNSLILYIYERGNLSNDLLYDMAAYMEYRTIHQSIITAFHDWVENKQLRMKNKTHVFISFLRTGEWSDDILPSEEDWLCVQYGFQLALQKENHHKLWQITSLWRYFISTVNGKEEQVYRQYVYSLHIAKIPEVYINKRVSIQPIYK